jgi:hypothetical protein
VVVSGPPGIGKTSAACAFTRRTPNVWKIVGHPLLRSPRAAPTTAGTRARGATAAEPRAARRERASFAAATRKGFSGEAQQEGCGVRARRGSIRV